MLSCLVHRVLPPQALPGALAVAVNDQVNVNVNVNDNGANRESGSLIRPRKLRWTVSC
jgi:hypothetical protein